MISNIIDLHGRRSIAFIHLRTEQALQAWRSRDEDDFMAVKYFTLNSVNAVAKNGRMKKKFRSWTTQMRKSFCHESHLNVTSLSSGLLTNLGSIRDPFTGCRTVSLIGFIGSQPKHVLKISAKSNVVPSFCKHDTNNEKNLCPGKFSNSEKDFLPLSSLFFNVLWH